MEIKTKKEKKKFSFTVIFFIAGIFLAVTISMSAFQEAYRSRKIEQEVESLKLQAQNIQKENDALNQQIAYLQTPEFQEKIAKEKLNMQKPDENVVVVKPSVTADAQTPQNQDQKLTVERDIPNYIKWWNFFFKYE